jgi:hypothetical protein
VPRDMVDCLTENLPTSSGEEGKTRVEIKVLM